MKTTHHSEVHQLKSVYLKSVDNSFISDKNISQQWEGLNYLSKPDFRIAIEEYAVFERLLLEHGAHVHHFPLDKTLSMDAVYCRDASIATNVGMILCNMGKSGRVGEPASQKSAFIANGMPILGEITSPGTLEGGDVAWLNESTLAVGHTYRTNIEGIKQLKVLLEPEGIEVIVAELPHYKGPSDVFHLMSILSPVAEDLAVIYSPLMPISFRNELLKRGFKFVEVPEEEFESMGCNVLALAPKKCLTVAGNPKTEDALKAAGCEVITYQGSHISVMGGGGPTCLTRPIVRNL